MINLRRAFLANTFLGEADFTKADFTEADLGKANLERAFLSEANLTRADLTKANLTETHFTAAYLGGALLSGANLTRSHLWKADLKRADLNNVNLTEANFDNNYIAHSLFVDNDLSLCKGLETALHFGPSHISTDTIHKSKSKIPIEFLRGCGLSDLDIEHAKLAAPGLDPEQVKQITHEIHRLYCDQPIQFYSCFISYNSSDQEFAQHLHDDLQDSGVRCWFAPEDLKIGDEFRRTVGQQIRFRDKLLIILSENSIKSEWVGDEVEKALAEEKEQGKLKLFPIRIDDAVLKAKDDWAEKIRLRRHIGDFTDYDKGFARLLRDLRAS